MLPFPGEFWIYPRRKAPTAPNEHRSLHCFCINGFHHLLSGCPFSEKKKSESRKLSDHDYHLTFKAHQQAALLCIEAAQAAGLANGHLGLRKFRQHQLL